MIERTIGRVLLGAAVLGVAYVLAHVAAAYLGLDLGRAVAVAVGLALAALIFAAALLGRSPAR